MKRRFLLDYEGKHSAAEWLCSVFGVCLCSSVPVSPFLWLRYRFEFCSCCPGISRFDQFSRLNAEPVDVLLGPVSLEHPFCLDLF